VIEAFDRLSGRLNTEEEKKEEAARKAYEKMMGLANATGAVADVFITFNKEIYNGKSANQAASESIHKMSDAVKVATAAFLMFAPGGIIIKGVVAALALLTSKLIESGALVSDQAEEVYKAYQQMAKTGATGAGVPVGGTTGQVLAKINATDYNTQWTTASGGSAGDSDQTILPSQIFG
jgi:hypothetical protein